MSPLSHFSSLYFFSRDIFLNWNFFVIHIQFSFTTSYLNTFLRALHIFHLFFCSHNCNKFETNKKLTNVLIFLFPPLPPIDLKQLIWCCCWWWRCSRLMSKNNYKNKIKESEKQNKKVLIKTSSKIIKIITNEAQKQNFTIFF